jgi:hypothetical protein
LVQRSDIGGMQTDGTVDVKAAETNRNPQTAGGAIRERRGNLLTVRSLAGRVPIACLFAVVVVSSVLAAVSGASQKADLVGLTVTSQPKNPTNRHFATFRFEASPAVVDFKCKLDDRPHRPCSSPVTFRHLRSGTHYLQIEASVKTEHGGESADELLRWTIR